MRRYLSVAGRDCGGFASLLDVADELRRERHERGAVRTDPAGPNVAMVLEKPSMRTRVSFQVAVADTGAVLSRYVHAVVVRTFAQRRLDALAESATVPVVNALTAEEHPCQALTDLQTVRAELGGLVGVTLPYVGDGNNVAHSLLLAGALTGVTVRIAHPAGQTPDAVYVEWARGLGGDVQVTRDPHEAVAGVDVVYADVWASMGQEDEAEVRRARFAPYRVDAGLMAHAADHAIFMHCLPVHRGEEVTDEVIDGPTSRVFDQAENRLHTQKALLVRLLGGRS